MNNMQKFVKQSSFAMLLTAGTLFSTLSRAQVRIGDNLGNHKATRLLDMAGYNVDAAGSQRYATSAISLGVSGSIGTAAATVDVFTAFNVSATATSLSFTLPAPAVTGSLGAGRVAIVTNTGSNSFTIGGVTIAPGQHSVFVYNGTSWFAATGTASSLPFNGLTAATAANGGIDNTNFAQSWNWSTATTQNPLSLSAAALTTGSLLSLNANALTTGSLLNLTSNSAVNVGNNGLLYVANLNAATTGTVARIQSNSTAGSGITVLANGNTGLGIAAPAATLHNNGSTILGGMLAVSNLATGGAIGTNLTTVDVKTVFTVNQTTAGQAITVPAPTDATAGRVATVINTGTASFTLNGTNLPAGAAISLVWNGSAWSAQGNTTGKAMVAVPVGANAALNTTTVGNNAGSSNLSYTITLTVTGVLADDAVVVNYASADYNASGWLAPGTAGAGQNDGVVILSAVATAANTVQVTIANLVAGSAPAIEGLRLSVGYHH